MTSAYTAPGLEESEAEKVREADAKVAAEFG